jgi:hypothetical protein
VVARKTRAAETRPAADAMHSASPPAAMHSASHAAAMTATAAMTAATTSVRKRR